MPLITQGTGIPNQATPQSEPGLPTTSETPVSSSGPKTFNGVTNLNPVTHPGLYKEQLVQDEIPQEVGIKEYVKAYRKENNSVMLIGKYFDKANIDQTPEPGFNAVSTLNDQRPDLAARANEFIDVPNSETYRRKVFDIDYENQQTAIMQRADTTTKIVGTILGETLDPLNLFYVVRGLKIANTGRRVVAAVATGAASGLGVSSIKEGLKLSANENSNVTESAYNIIAETAVGGILGGVIGAIASPVKQAARVQLANALKGSEDFKFTLSPEGNPIGVTTSPTKAKEYTELDKEGLAYLNDNFAKILSGPEFLRAPDLRAILSPSVTVRKLGDSFYNSSYIKQKHVDGIASEAKASNLINRKDNQALLRLKEVENGYLDYIGKGRVNAALTGTPEGKLSLIDYDKRLWKNLTDPNHIETIPQLKTAAAAMRKDMDNIAKELIDEGFLPSDMDPVLMRNYMHRVYNLDSLSSIDAQNSFVNKVGAWIENFNRDGTPRDVALSSSDARDIARQSLQKIRGESEEQVALQSIAEDFISKGKFLKDRHLLIPDSEIAEFLDQDAAKIYKNYTYKTARLLEVNKSLKNQGFDSIEKVKSQIDAEAQAAKQGLKGDDPKNLQIDKEFKDQKDLVDMMHRSMLGQLRTPGKADRWFEALLNYQYIRLLGGVTLSSLPDIAMAPFKQGLFKTFRSGYLPLVRSFKTTKLAKDQLTDWIGAMELEQNNIIGSLGGLDDMQNMLSGKSKMERYLFDPLRSSTKIYSKAIGITYWTDMGRRIASQVASAETVRSLKAFKVKGKLSKDEITHLATHGIGKDDYASILRQIDKHVQERDGSFIINPHLWTDKAALDKFASSIQTQVEGTILRPGVETTPFFAQKSLAGKVLFQFKSFAAASTGRILISSLERRDATALTGLMLLVGMGTLTWIAKQKLAGNDISHMSETDLILKGVNQSGVLGLFWGSILSTSMSMANPDTRKYGGKSVQDTLLGPTVGQIQDIGNLGNRILKDKWTNDDTQAAARNLPFLNIFYLKTILDKLAPKSKKKKSKSKRTNSNPLGDQ